jgi:hypothetical protein
LHHIRYRRNLNLCKRLPEVREFQSYERVLPFDNWILMFR